MLWEKGSCSLPRKQQSHSVVEKPTPQIQILFYVHSINGANCVSATGVATFFSEPGAPLAERRRECRLPDKHWMQHIHKRNRHRKLLSECCGMRAREIIEHHHRHRRHRSLGYHRYRSVYSQCHSIFIPRALMIRSIPSFAFFPTATFFSISLLPWFLMCRAWPCMKHERTFCVHSHLAKLVGEIVSPGKNARKRFLFFCCSRFGLSVCACVGVVYIVTHSTTTYVVNISKTANRAIRCAPRKCFTC